MSFLDRFQNKIATVTAHGHLKKADGSEEIRVGAPKRKQQLQSNTFSSNKSNNEGDQGKKAGNINIATSNSNGMKAGKQSAIAVPSLPMQHQLSTHPGARQGGHPSPTSSSPKNKSGRDPHGTYDNNNHHHQRYDNDSYLYDHGSMPGRLRDDDYGYDRMHSGRNSGMPSQSPLPNRDHYQYQDDRSWNQPLPQEHIKNRSPRAQEQPQKECRSPKEINEARVRTDQDQLAFSRKARPVQYEPCKLSQYKKEKPNGYYELGKLQPDLNSDELVQKRANMERIKAFSKNLRNINKSATQVKKSESNNDESAQPPKVKSNRDKALAFAKHIPKPKQRTGLEDSGTTSSVSSSKIPIVASHPRPINSVIDDDSDDDLVSSELQQLQLQHQVSRAQVNALINKS